MRLRRRDAADKLHGLLWSAGANQMPAGTLLDHSAHASPGRDRHRHICRRLQRQTEEHSRATAHKQFGRQLCGRFGQQNWRLNRLGHYHVQCKSTLKIPSLTSALSIKKEKYNV